MSKAPGADCENCPLNEVGKFTPSEGPDHAELAFIGEAPGHQEARSGRPFIGPSGKLLDTVMEHHGFERGKVFLSNACLCRPPGNDAPPKKAIEACRPRLAQELRERGVSTIVALGNSAAQAVLGSNINKGITKLRVGPPKASALFPEIRVIPTIHPSACLRVSDNFPHLVTDVGKIKDLDVGEWKEPEYIVVDNEQTALQAISELGKYDELVVDIEAGIEKDISFDHPNRYQMLCIGVCYARGKAVVFGEQACQSTIVRQRLRKLFSAKKLIGHNLKFDLGGLYPILGGLKAYFDTMIAHYCLDERPGIHGLKALSAELLGAPDYEKDIDSYIGGGKSYALIPRPVLYKYNAYDVVCTFSLYHIFRQRLEEESPPDDWFVPEGATLRSLHDFLVSAANELMYMELNGIGLDLQYLDDLTESYLGRIAEVRSSINELVDDPINPNSPVQVKAALEKLGAKVASTDKETLTFLLETMAQRGRMEEPLYAFVERLLVHRREAKLYGTYIKGARSRLYRGRLHPTFLVHGTTTGRLSCRNPNLQNIPRESVIRRLYVPTKPENVFVQPDYSQAELRVLTWLAQEPYFRDIFNDPTRDIFDELAPVLYPTTDILDAAHKKELRIRIKAYVYGLAYGREAYSIAQEFRISTQEALRGMQAFFEVIPNIVAFRNETQERILSGQDLVTPFGRHRRFWLITEHNKQDVLKEGLAFYPQSTSSDICLGSAATLRRDLRGKAFLRNIVHDSILAECHKDDAEWVGAHMQKVMEQKAIEICGTYVKFATDCKIGHNWAEV